MEPFEVVLAVINIVAVIFSPIIAVVIGQALQARSETRKDKLQIFQCLMTHRATGWANLNAVNALNLIDIVFADNEQVRAQWQVLLSKYRPEVLRQEQAREECKLLELMARDLGYKDKITWDNIQNPYYPKGLDQQIALNSQITGGQAKLDKIADLFLQNVPSNSIHAMKPTQMEPPHADS